MANEPEQAAQDGAKSQSSSNFQARAVGGDPGLLKALWDYFAADMNVLESGDLLLITGGRPPGRAGLTAAVLSGLGLEGGARAIEHYRIILPPAADVTEARERFWNRFSNGFRVLSGTALAGELQEWFEERIELVAAAELRSGWIIQFLRQQAEQTAVIITEAALFRDETVEPFVAPGESGPLAPEDIWVPQLFALAQAAVPIAQQRTLYVAFDANELAPVNPALQSLLQSVDRFGILSAESSEARETILAQRVRQWDTWITSGHIGLALRDVAALPKNFDSEKAFLRVQLLGKAGLTVQALAEIRSDVLPASNPSPDARTRLALIAWQAGADNLAREILEPVIDQLEGLDELQSALRTLDAIKDIGLADRVSTRLEARFPMSAGLKEHRRQRLLEARDYAAVAVILRPDNPTRAAYYDAIGKAFSAQGVPDYLALIDSGSDATQRDQYRLASARDAYERGLVIHAFELARSQPGDPDLAGPWERVLLSALELCFLNLDAEGNPPVSIDEIGSAVLALVRRLSTSPRSAHLRSGLYSLLRQNLAGPTGHALIAKICIDESRRPVQIDKGIPMRGRRATWIEENQTFIDNAMTWLGDETPIVMGKLALPIELLTVDPDDAVAGISACLEAIPLSDESDVQVMQLFLTLGATIAPHSADPDVDLRLYRLACGKLVSAGFPQHGRDLVETAVESGADTPRRRRLAWLAVADVYHRSQDYLNGMLALACALSADDRVDEEPAWQETYALVRLMRDIGITPMAFAAIERARQLMDSLGFTKRYGHRIDLMALQTRQKTLRETNAEEVLELLREAVRIGKAVIAEQDQTAPSAAALGQLIRTARRLELAIPDDAQATFDELAKWAGGNLASFVKTVSVNTPSVGEVAQLAANMPQARYSDDVGYDTRQLSMLAQRALSGSAILDDSQGLRFLLDAMADWGAAIPGWDEAAAPPRPPQLEDALATAKRISELGVAVLQMAFDADGRFVRAVTIDGTPAAGVREPEERFSETAFKAWAPKFPWLYAYDDSPNLFYTTTEHLRLTDAPRIPTIVVASSRLQAFPPNILSTESNGEYRELLGREIPLAAVPSLAWLSDARERNWTGDGRHVAWISTADSGDGRITMPLLAQRLEAPLADYDFAANFNSQVPTDFAGSTIAVIGAHGDIHPDNSFFQRVSDEGSLKISGEDLARALRNIGVVILFVCSGGRSDQHPGANTTIGLAKEILDRGCAAVVASPWPLDSQIPPHWLPAFLDSWIGGATLMEAVFAANKFTDVSFSLDARSGLAMTVYGDGLLKYPHALHSEQ